MLFCSTIANQQRDDSSEFFLHQITDDLVVEIWHRFPLRAKTRAAWVDQTFMYMSWLRKIVSLCELLGLYLNPLRLVLLLFWFEGQLDEKLLQLLIAEVDAKLFEAETKNRSCQCRTLLFEAFALDEFAQKCEISPVHVENFKPVDVQQTNHCFPGGILRIAQTDVKFLGCCWLSFPHSQWLWVEISAHLVS